MLPALTEVPTARPGSAHGPRGMLAARALLGTRADLAY
jgi:hypothetical protein